MDDEPGLLLEDCYAISPENELIQYPLHTDQRFLFLTTSDVMTILDPSPTIVVKYKEVNE